MLKSTFHPEGRPVAFAQLDLQRRDPFTQPSEPILFPKLRIYFADFPYLLYSIDQDQPGLCDTEARRRDAQQGTRQQESFHKGNKRLANRRQ